MNSLKNKIGVTVRNDDVDENVKILIASLVALDTMRIETYQLDGATVEKQRRYVNKAKDRLIQSLLSYDEIKKLREEAYNSGYEAGFHDAMVELDPNTKPLNSRGYIA